MKRKPKALTTLEDFTITIEVRGQEIETEVRGLKIPTTHRVIGVMEIAKLTHFAMYTKSSDLTPSIEKPTKKK